MLSYLATVATKLPGRRVLPIVHNHVVCGAVRGVKRAEDWEANGDESSVRHAHDPGAGSSLGVVARVTRTGEAAVDSSDVAAAA